MAKTIYSFTFDAMPPPTSKYGPLTIKQQVMAHLPKLKPGVCMRISSDKHATRISWSVRMVARKMGIPIMVRADGENAVRVWLKPESQEPAPEPEFSDHVFGGKKIEKA